MNISYLSRNEYEKWDEFVRLHDQGTLFHTSAWLGQQIGVFKILTVQEDSNIVGGFAYLISKKVRIKGIFRPPYTPYYHPLLMSNSQDGNSEKETEILDLILRELKNYNISLIFNSKVDYFLPYQNKGFEVSPKLNYTLNPTEFLENLNKRKKSAIKKLKKGVESGAFVISEDRNAKEILTIWDNFGKEKSMNTYLNFLEKVFAINADFNDWNCLKIKNRENVLLAAGLYLFDDNKMYNLIPMVNYKLLKKEERNIGDLLYDQLICRAEEMNVVFDFEGSEVPGVEKMYRRLGGRIDLKHTAVKYSHIMKFIYFSLNIYKQVKRTGV